MKVAKQKIPVYSPNGKYVIGDLGCGQKTLVLGEVDEGVVIAYVLGIVKPQHSDMLVSEQDYEREVGERDRFVAWAEQRVGQECKEFVVQYLRDRGLADNFGVSSLYFYGCDTIDKADLSAGDLVFRFKKASGMDYVGVYMGDGSVVYIDERSGRACRERLNTAVWRRFARIKAFAQSETKSAVFTRRLKALSKPMRGDDVRALQVGLNENALVVDVDGIYGKKTSRAVRAYQKEAGSKADGAVDAATWDSLMGGV